MNYSHPLYIRVEKPCIIGKISTYSCFGEYVSGKANGFTCDGGEGITIAWNTSGKVKSVTGGSSPLDFSYSASGQRQMKAYLTEGGKASDYYIHDAMGNIMAIYTLSDNYSRFQLKERHIYGSSRLGIYQRDIGIYPSEGTLPLSFTRGLKRYELPNHLGNVISIFSDRKRQGKVGFYTVDHKGLADYYPFGYQMPQRTVKSADYRFGFNGQEKDDEIYGEGNSTTAEYWQYDARLGRRWNLDPVVRPFYSGYATFSNNPIIMVDPGGDADYYTAGGQWIGTDEKKDNLLVIVSSPELIAEAKTATTEGKSLDFGYLKNGSRTDDYYAIDRRVLLESYHMLNRSLSEGANKEFSKTLLLEGDFLQEVASREGNITSWKTGATVELVKSLGIFTANISIHSHTTGYRIVNGGGGLQQLHFHQ